MYESVSSTSMCLFRSGPKTTDTVGNRIDYFDTRERPAVFLASEPNRIAVRSDAQYVLGKILFVSRTSQGGLGRQSFRDRRRIDVHVKHPVERRGIAAVFHSGAERGVFDVRGYPRSRAQTNTCTLVATGRRSVAVRSLTFCRFAIS